MWPHSHLICTTTLTIILTEQSLAYTNLPIAIIVLVIHQLTSSRWSPCSSKLALACLVALREEKLHSESLICACMVTIIGAVMNKLIQEQYFIL